MHTHKKLHISHAHDRQLVTGLVVNDHVNLPRSTRRWLRAVEHRRATGNPATLTDEQIAGWKALRAMVAAQSRPRVYEEIPFDADPTSGDPSAYDFYAFDGW